jgi:hypothetical protein
LYHDNPTSDTSASTLLLLKICTRESCASSTSTSLHPDPQQHNARLETFEPC